MNAQEAKKLSETSLSQNAQTILEKVYSLIRKAAGEGRTAITNPFIGFTSSTGLLAARRQLENDGFKIKDDYDQRENASWTTLSW